MEVDSVRVFKNAYKKINNYNKQNKAMQYNSAYRRVLNARMGNRCLVDETGNVSESSLQVVEDALRAFEMARFGQMDDKFKERLKKKLENVAIRTILKRLRNVRIDSPSLQEYESAIERLYNTLSSTGSDGLSATGKRFDVGATKIMNFIFPELLVMVDKNVAKALVNERLIKIPRKGSTYDFSFKSYWKVMLICRQELEEWKKLHKGIQSLLGLDREPTTLTRIFDKCAFSMKLK